MYKRLSVRESEIITQRILKGEQVSKVARDEGVSRTILYKWLKKHKFGKNRDKKNFIKAPRWNSLSKEKEKEIIKIAIKNPRYTVAGIASMVGVSGHGVWNVLKRCGLNTQKAREEYVQVNGSSMVKPVPLTDRVSMIRRYEAGDRAWDICRDFGISHTLFYRFLKRYKQANKERGALENFRPKGERHWRYKPGIEELVLQIVAEKPELTAEKLAIELREWKGETLIGAHGIYNLLKRLELNTYEKRRAYADSQKAAGKEFVGPIPARTLPAVPRYSFISFLSPPFLKSIFTDKKTVGIVFLSSFAFLIVGFFTFNIILQTQGFIGKIGIIFSLMSLLFGIFFFLYSLKYYISIAIVLSYSRREKGKGRVGGFFSRVFGVSIEIETESSAVKNTSKAGVGFQSDLSDVVLERNPFVSIHVSTYNEKRVIDRLLTACTSFDYPNYEVIVADDSNDETVELINKWAHHPRIKISHRDNRDGFKGAALAEALKKTDKRAEYVMVFDADFIPYPDTITQFLKYFQKAAGTLDFSSTVIPNSFRDLPDKSKQMLKQAQHDKLDQASGSNIAAVQGYQWHVLNKSENWITRGVRSEYAGSYVIERSGAELYNGLKQISGSVYMIRRDVLQIVGWGKSITEDFELTLKLYEVGYKVVYTPYIQAPAEAVSTIRRLIRQRMRWAEGHSFNIKRMLVPLLFGRWENAGGIDLDENSKLQLKSQKLSRGGVFRPSPLTFAEKLELVYLTPYYLQAAFFMIGTICWFVAETIFQVRLPFWTEVWGWSLVITNLLALPFMNLIGLFMEEARERDYLGLFSFVAISYIVAPFQAYAAVKGFLEKEEGPWFRTPKTGRITDIFTRGRFYRYVFGLFGEKSGTTSSSLKAAVEFSNSANNPFNKFNIKRKRIRGVGKVLIVILLVFSTTIGSLASRVPTVEAATQLLYNHSGATDGTGGYPLILLNRRLETNSPHSNSVEKCGKYGKAGAGTIERIPDGTNCNSTLGETEGSGGEENGYAYISQSGTYPAADGSNPWKFDVRLRNPTVGSTTGNYMLYAKVYVYNGSTYSTKFYSLYGDSTNGCPTSKPARTAGTAITPSTTAYTLSWSCTNAPAVDVGVDDYLYVQYFLEINTASSDNGASLAFVEEGQEVTNCTTVGTGCSKLQTTNFGVPESALLLLPVIHFIPMMVHKLPEYWEKIRKFGRKRRRRNEA